MNSRRSAFLSAVGVTLLGITIASCGSSDTAPNTSATPSRHATARASAPGQGTATPTSAAAPGWHVKMVDPGQGFTAISCPSTNFCAAGDLDGRVFTWTNGGSWQSTALSRGDGELSAEDGSISSISCWAAGACVAGGSDGQVWALVNGAWTQTSFPLAQALAAYVSCVSESFCGAVAVGDPLAAIATVDELTAGQQVGAVGGNVPGGLVSASCIPSLCYLIPYPGGTLSYSDGNTLTTTSTGLYGILSMSCTTSNWCMAVGLQSSTSKESLAVSGTETTWDKPQVVASDPSDSLYSVSCPTSAWCAAAGGTSIGAIAVYSGGGWNTPIHVSLATNNKQGPAGFDAISCAAPNQCVAVDDAGEIAADDPAMG
jgi:hypothetical protein